MENAISKGQRKMKSDMRAVGKDFLILFISSILCILVSPIIWLSLINKGVIADGFLALLGCFLSFAIPIIAGFIVCHLRDVKRFEQFKEEVTRYYNCNP